MAGQYFLSGAYLSQNRNMTNSQVDYGGRIYTFSSVNFTMGREKLFFITFLSFLWKNTICNRLRHKF